MKIAILALAVAAAIPAGSIVIPNCFIHTERDSMYMTPGSAPDLYEYMENGAPKLCGEIYMDKAGTFHAESEANKAVAGDTTAHLSSQFETRDQARTWLETMCRTMHR